MVDSKHRQRFDFAYVVLCLPAALVLTAQTNTVFTTTGYIDPWFYVGFFSVLHEFQTRTISGHVLRKPFVVGSPPIYRPSDFSSRRCLAAVESSLPDASDLAIRKLEPVLRSNGLVAVLRAAKRIQDERANYSIALVEIKEDTAHLKRIK
jgi:hypothetical protein